MNCRKSHWDCDSVKISNSLNLALERGDILAVDVMIKEVELGHSKEALVWVNDNAMLTKALKHKLDVLQVLF